MCVKCTMNSIDLVWKKNVKYIINNVYIAIRWKWSYLHIWILLSLYFLMSLQDNVKLHMVHVMFLLDSAALNEKVGVWPIFINSIQSLLHFFRPAPHTFTSLEEPGVFDSWTLLGFCGMNGLFLTVFLHGLRFQLPWLYYNSYFHLLFIFRISFSCLLCFLLYSFCSFRFLPFQNSL